MSLSFLPATFPVSIDGPWGITTSHFNNDTKLYIALVGQQSSELSIQLSNGGGTFTQGFSFPVGSTPLCVAVADFNNDGWPDVAVTCANSSYVAILLNNHNGTFSFSYTEVPSPNGITTGDFNADGNIDLAVTSIIDGKVYIFLGNGDGTFQIKASYPAGYDGVVAADLNGDGTLDLAVADSSSTNVSILYGNGDGTFQDAIPIPAGITPQDLAAADFDGDGQIDLVVTGYFGVTIILRNSDGSFKVPVPLYTSADEEYNGVTVADFNNDGILDIAAVNTSKNSVSVFVGNGDGTFQVPLSFAVGNYPVKIAAGNFNKYKIDLAVTDYSSDSLALLLNSTNLAAWNMTAAASPNPVIAGANLTYLVTIRNTGLDDITNIILTDILPPNVIFISSSAGCDAPNGTVTCQLGSFAPGENKSVSIIVKPTQAGIINNIINLTSTEASPLSSAVSTQVDSAPKIIHLAAPTPAVINQNLTYYITISNPASIPLTNVIATDVLPANVDFVSSSSGCLPANGTVTCNLDTIQPGENRTIKIIVKPTQGGTISNLVTITAAEIEPIQSELIIQAQDTLYNATVNLNTIVSWSILDSRERHGKADCSLQEFLQYFQGSRISLQVLGGWSATGILVRHDEDLVFLAYAALIAPSSI